MASLVTMVQEQSRRLQAMGDELDSVRTSLNERKLVERAKGLLMAHRQLTEEEAYKRLQQQSMRTRRSMREIAEAVILSSEMQM